MCIQPPRQVFQAGVLGACTGESRREIPAHLNNVTEARDIRDNRGRRMPSEVDVDFEFKVLDIVPKAAYQSNGRAYCEDANES